MAAAITDSWRKREGQMMIGRMLAAGLAWLVLGSAVAGELGDPELGAIAYDQAVRNLGTDLRLLCVAAHPDDEDGATLAYYRKKFGIDTYALIATRGEGGQNEIGPELYEELGVIRTHEMMRASQITGAELHFLDLPEFGYSKTREETYEIWGEEETLRRMVRKIREIRPDVIITHHPPDTQHGHHQAVGDALQRAFDLAADPTVFPEQLDAGLEPWQPARLYLRSFGGGGSGPAAVVPISELDPARGIPYARIAANALEEHESQGMGFFVDRFLTSRASVTYQLIKEAPQGHTSGVPAPGASLFQGLEDRVAPRARELSVRGLERRLDPAAVVALLDDGSLLPETRTDANRLAAVLYDFRLMVEPDDLEVVPGQTVQIAVEAQDYGTLDAESVAVSAETAEWFPAEPPAPKTLTTGRDPINSTALSVRVPEDQPVTLPHPERLFEPHFLAPQITVVARFRVDGAQIELRKPVLLDVAPPVSIEFADGPYLARAGVGETIAARVRFTNHTKDAVETGADLDAAEGVAVSPSMVSVSLAAEGLEKSVPVQLDVARSAAEGDYAVHAETDRGTRADSFVRVVDVTVPEDIRVGVIQSYDDTFVKTLERLKVPHELIGENDFTAERLDRFTTIIVDIRAYLVREDLVANNAALLDYVNRGGTVIVNYQKTFDWKPEYAPYPIHIGRDRVTVEEAPIEILEPDHPLFNEPNQISPEDWEGWIQERGLYFPRQWDDAYTPLVMTRDPGETPPPGSCLMAPYGEGTYFYTALGWYRQLRELHPGTIRVFANMLAL